MKRLPIGEQNFRKLRSHNMLYVDKTQLLHRLATQGSYYFLSRPRRFGKSLNLSTLEEMFRGSKELFEGLWVENNWDWSQQNPVIHLSFAKLDYQAKGLEQALMDFLDARASEDGLVLTEISAKSKMTELLGKLYDQQAPVALLIDEYDKPLIDYLAKEEMPTAKANQKILKAFYSGLKDGEIQAALRILLITGVSKFSQVSVFSDLNYLEDITLDLPYGTLVGYTQDELENDFSEWIDHILEKMPGIHKASLLAKVKKWYNGYSWNGTDYVYNPFSILNFFKKGIFQDYWFKTGTPSFLIKLIKEKRYFNLNELRVSRSLFESYDLDNLEIRSLLFQTGYLTIKKVDWQRGWVTLDYPNQEVEEAMHNYLIASLLGRTALDSARPIEELEDAFLKNEPARAVTVINAMLKDVPSHLIQKNDEHFYHALVHLLFRYLGLYMESEVHTSDGRMDAVVKTDNHIFIFEFKLNQSAEAALKQVREKDYAAKFMADGKPITAIGINFNMDKRAVDDWGMGEIGNSREFPISPISNFQFP